VAPAAPIDDAPHAENPHDDALHAKQRPSFEDDPARLAHHHHDQQNRGSGVVSQAKHDAVAFQLETSAAAAVGTAMHMRASGIV
jgi:hypothetical protein